MAIVGGAPAEQDMVALFSWAMHACLGQFAFHSDVLCGATWHPRLDQLAVGGADGRLAPNWTPYRAKCCKSATGACALCWP